MSVRIVPVQDEHIISIAPRMRAADVEEVRAASGRDPVEALVYSAGRSDFAYTVLFNGKAEAMFGCGTTDMINRAGAPWLLGTDAIEDHPRHFLRGSKYWLGQMLARYRLLRNVVDDRNVASKRWLEWLGFSLGEPIPYGYERLPFRIFEMKVSDV